MRRSLSIFLILLFGLGPLGSTLHASDDSRLPPCCRRHGAHHCAMPMRMNALMAQFASGGKPVLTAPAHCPSFPGYTAAPALPVLALSTPQAGLPVLLGQPHSHAAARAAVRLSPIRTHAGRGPPASTVA